jgi:ABC-type cobalamin/Fe3+-siderophores transport system ATPase subunit
LQKPNEGKILIDNKDLNTISNQWMSSIGYISQNIFLVNDTIENNIALGIPKDQISSSRISEVISQVQLTSYIDGNYRDINISKKMYNYFEASLNQNNFNYIVDNFINFYLKNEYIFNPIYNDKY